MTTKAEFTFSYLSQVHRSAPGTGDYIHSIYEAWCQFHPVKAGNYKDFCKVISLLHKEGKIEAYRREPARQQKWGRVFYRVVPGKI